MNTYQQGFKSDLLNTVFSLAGKLWLKVTGAYAIQSVVLLIIMATGLLSLGFYDDFAAIGKMTNPQEILDYYQNIIEGLVIMPKFYIGLFVFVIIGGIIGSWFYNFAFMLTKVQIKEEQSSFSNLLQLSFSKDVFRILGAALLLYLFFVVGAIIAAATSGISGLIAFALFLVLIVFMNRFFLVIPAIALEKKTLSESFAYSFKHMTWGRALKLFGIMILTGIILGIVYLIILLVAKLFGFIPVLGKIIEFAIQLGMGGFISALMVAALSALYYRYSDDLEQSEEINVNDLLVSE
jgi:hypothetical protein